MQKMEDNSVDSIVTDPPYGLSFMGKKWDYDVPSVEIWKEALRVLKPGGHLLSFAGSRTYHRMAVNIEDAGFEIRDQIMWVYGSGFPKSHNIGKAVDKMQGNEREFIQQVKRTGKEAGTLGAYAGNNIESKGTSPYEGWGTNLKPAHEPIVVARKPISESTIAENVLRWGTGGINIEKSRVGTEERTYSGANKLMEQRPWNERQIEKPQFNVSGRFPANFIHDGSDEVVGLFPDTKPSKARIGKVGGQNGLYKNNHKPDHVGQWHGGSGSAARFFKTCKDTQKHAIMSVCNDINVNNVGNNLMISQLTEKIVKIHSVLKSATPNLDLLNQNLNALFVERSAKSTEIDFVAKLVAIKEVPEDLVSQEELQAIQGFIGNCKECSLTQRNADAEKWESIDITQITTNLLKLCGYVSYVIEENTSSERKEVVAKNGEPKRFGYFPKASKRDRDGSSHPTMKPTALMQYLVRLVTPAGGTCLDPFMGSGSTGKACVLEGFGFIGIEMDAEYCDIAEARIQAVQILED